MDLFWSALSVGKLSCLPEREEFLVDTIVCCDVGFSIEDKVSVSVVIETSDDFIEFEFMERSESECEVDVGPFVVVVLVSALLGGDESPSNGLAKVLLAGVCAGGIGYEWGFGFEVGFLRLYLFLLLVFLRGERAWCVGLGFVY